MSVLKVETDIITIIAVSPSGRTELWITGTSDNVFCDLQNWLFLQ